MEELGFVDAQLRLAGVRLTDRLDRFEGTGC
jgi:hypothetical protein